ncbi:MAG: hypothetical protein ACRD0K_10045 [Egibacteraceae bacterium]
MTDHVQVRKVRVSRWTLWRIRECARYIGQRAVNDEGIARDPVLGARVEVWGNGTVVLV